jgi:hypothetical protein
MVIGHDPWDQILANQNTETLLSVSWHRALVFAVQLLHNKEAFAVQHCTAKKSLPCVAHGKRSSRVK